MNAGVKRYTYKTFLLLLLCVFNMFEVCSKQTSSYQQLKEQSKQLYNNGDTYGCLAITERVLQELNQSADTLSYEYTWFLHTSAGCYFRLRKYESALKEIQRCVSISRCILGTHDVRYVQRALAEAEIYAAMNLKKQSDSVLNVLLDETKDVPRYNYSIKSQQVKLLLMYYNDYEGAILCGGNTILDYQERMINAKSRRERKKYTIDADDLIAIYDAIGASYHEIGNNRLAILWTEGAIDIMQNYLGYSLLDCSTEYINIAQIYKSMGECENAKKYGEFAAKCDKEANKYISYASSAKALASIYAHCGDNEQAINYAKSALETIKYIYGDMSSKYYSTLGNLACYYAANGDVHTAIKCAKEVYEYYVNNNILETSILQNIAAYSYFLGNDSALYYRDLSFTSSRYEIIENLRKMTSNSRQTYINKEIPGLRSLIWSPKPNYMNDTRFNKTSYNIALLIKNSSVGIENEITDYIKKYGDNNQIQQYATWKIMQQSSNDGHQNTLFEQELLNSIRQKGFDYLSYLNVTHNDVKQHLSPCEIGVEITYCSSDTSNYFALILRKDWDTPKCVILGRENELETMSYPQLQKTIWQAIIDSAQIKEGESIYFAPDGIFYNIPIEYLPTADGQCMSDKYNMYRVSSTRELCYRDTATVSYSSAVLYGGLKYDATSQNLLAQNTTLRGWSDNMHENVWEQWRADDRARYNYLPYTLREVDSISQTIGDTIQVTTYTDQYGNEDSFKALSGQSPSILHLATHGYYITPTDAEVMSQEYIMRYGVSSMDEQYSIIDYSMERTGLLLAGAQYKLRGDTLPQGAEDGILSAKEISHLDLSNTDLVVLSACQTALGDITNDGVAGLQRGFKIAGVNSILMSLWKVDDVATYLLMKQFYKSLMAGKSKQQALKDAQHYLRTYFDGKDFPYADIKYWGAFVLLDALEK